MNQPHIEIEEAVERIWNKRPAITASSLECTMITKDELRTVLTSLFEQGKEVQRNELMKALRELGDIGLASEDAKDMKYNNGYYRAIIDALTIIRNSN